MTKFLDLMEKQHYKPDSQTFITTFRALGLRGVIQQAPLALGKMKRAGFVLNSTSYNGMIALLLRSGFQREAMDVYRNMISEGLVPSIKCYSALMVPGEKRETRERY